MVATRARSGVTSPRPSGCTRFDRNTTNTRVAGSIQSDVPVNPVWPNDPSGSNSPRLAEYDESMSQPRPRTFGFARRRRRRRHARRPSSGESTRVGADGAAAEQHAAEDREVGGRAEEPRVPGDAAHAPRRRIVHDAAQQRRPAAVGADAWPIERAAAALNIVSRMPSGVKHALLHELVERLLADPLDDLGQQEVVDVAVDEPPARRRRQDLFGREPDGRVVAVPRVAQIDVRPQAGHVRHQIAHGDAVLAVLRRTPE